MLSKLSEETVAAALKQLDAIHAGERPGLIDVSSPYLAPSNEGLLDYADLLLDRFYNQIKIMFLVRRPSLIQRSFEATPRLTLILPSLSCHPALQLGRSFESRPSWHSLLPTRYKRASFFPFPRLLPNASLKMPLPFFSSSKSTSTPKLTTHLAISPLLETSLLRFVDSETLRSPTLTSSRRTARLKRRRRTRGPERRSGKRTLLG